ncbi:MAG: hypothetical protein QOJ09_1180 [Actinomycetota bacterium]|nr:hypothetical protein [Actinomycetota bacterium]
MTATLEGVETLVDDTPGAPAPPPSQDPTPGSEPADEQVPLAVHLRPLLATALSSGAAGLLVGGIFGSIVARLLGLGAAWLGVGWALFALRSRRTALVQALLLPAALLVSILSLAVGGDSPSALPRLVRDAIDAGRLLRPPVPFDPGWRPIIIVLLSALGFAAAWVGTALHRPKLAVVLPLPVIGFTAISQAPGQEALAGIGAFVGILGSLAVLYGGDTDKAADLGTQFELKRAARGLAAAVPVVVVLVALNSASFLFPKPVYNPADKPQKPKPVPLSAAQDRVLFEVKTDAPITGPWRMGVLDVYDGTSWRLPPFDTKRFRPVPDGGGSVGGSAAAGRDTVSIAFTVRDLGDTSALPGVANASKITVSGQKVLFDPRAGIFRVPRGRAPAGLAYVLEAPVYPEAAQLEAAPPPGREVSEQLQVPKMPPAVRDLMAAAPTNPWNRLDYVRKKLNEVVVAVGQGSPKDVTPKRVEQLLVGNHEGSPFEIVAAEAMLARWAGVPSRIGFGFDGLNNENGVLTVRPRNAAQFLEVYFSGYGWVPLSSTPPKAKAKLDSDPNARFKPTIEPSTDVAVEIYIPVALKNLRLLYERVRDVLFRVAPFAIALAAIYLATPAARRALRRRRRRQWAAGVGPRAQIAVEYAEFRDLATDLNVGDPYATALEYLGVVQDDDEHAELAWLVARSLYGDLAASLSDDDVRAAEDMSVSLRRRLWRAQPVQTRALALVGRTSLARPYTEEIPR